MLVDGFTVVELVSVMVLLGLLGSFAVGRFNQSFAFDERLHSDRMLSFVRGSHLLAYSRADVGLYFSDVGPEIKLALLIGGVEKDSRSFPKSEVTIAVDGTSIGGSPGVCGSLTSPITLQFDSNAEVSGAYPSGNYNQGFPICLNGNTPNLCISPAGFAHLGSCV